MSFFPGPQPGGGGASGPVAVGDITATGTPSASTYLRGDGAWETPAAGGDPAQSHGRFGDATKGSTNTNIIKFGTAIGTPDSAVISHNDATFAAEGSIFTILEDGTYMINVSTSSATAGFGVYILYGTAADNTLQTIIGGETQPLNGTLCSFVNSRKVNFVAGDKVWVYCTNALTDFGAFNYLHSISIIKLTRGEKGDTGPAGEGAVPWQTATQGSNGNTLTLTLSPTGDVFEVVGQITSQSASSATEIEFNGSAGGHTYRHHFSGGVDNNAGGYFPPGVVGSGVTCYFFGTIQRTGTTIHADLNVSLPASALSHSVVYKAITGATNINALRVFSNQASGIGAGSFISARKVK